MPENMPEDYHKSARETTGKPRDFQKRPMLTVWRNMMIVLHLYTTSSYRRKEKEIRTTAKTETVQKLEPKNPKITQEKTFQDRRITKAGLAET